MLNSDELCRSVKLIQEQTEQKSLKICVKFSGRTSEHLQPVKDLYFDGDMEAAPALSGQSIGLINEVKSVKQIVDEIINEFNNTCESLGNIRF